MNTERRRLIEGIVFLIAFGLSLMVLLVYMLEYTRFGAVVRAAVDNQRMARGLGINEIGRAHV